MLTSMYILNICPPAYILYTPAHSHTQTVYSTVVLIISTLPCVYIQWGATALLSATFGGSVLVGKMCC